MRIHIQNLPGMLGDAITLDDWYEAAARAGMPDGLHVVSHGGTKEDFHAVAPDIEALVVATGATPALFPVVAPHLRLMFCTSAGLDAVPFGALPPGVQVMNNRGTHGPKAGEYGLMAILLLANYVPALMTQQRAGIWERRNSTLLRIYGRNTAMAVGY